MSGTLCLGEPAVDRIALPPAGVPVRRCLGGATAVAAVAAARAGGRVTLAGAIGDDEPGHWLTDRLAAEGVDVTRLRRLPDRATQVVEVTLDADGEPTYTLPEIATGGIVAALGEDPDAPLAEASGLFISSLTLAAPDERELTMAIRERALGHTPARPVIIDVNLRLHRFASRADAAASVNACIPDAVLVRATRAEAELITGEPDPERAALALRKAGARMVVITLGADGAIARGDRRLRIDRPAVAVDEVLSTVGAGDALTGTLIAALERTGYYPDAAAAALDDGLAAAARACARWGAID